MFERLGLIHPGSVSLPQRETTTASSPNLHKKASIFKSKLDGRLIGAEEVAKNKQNG